MIGLYIVTPILRINYSKADKKLIDFLIAVSLLLGAVYCFFAAFILEKSLIRSLNALTFFLPYIGYYIAGHRLKNFTGNKSQLIFCSLLFGSAYLSGVFSTFLFVKEFGMNSTRGLYFYYSLSPTIIIMSLMAFILLKKFCEKILTVLPLQTHKVIIYASRLSFGVYLIHPLLITFLNKHLQMTGIFSTIWIGMPVFFVMLLAVSFLVCSVLLKIPIVKNIIE